MFKSIETRVKVTKAIKSHQVIKGTRDFFNDKKTIPTEELPMGILQANGKLKSC